MKRRDGKRKREINQRMNEREGERKKERVSEGKQNRK